MANAWLVGRTSVRQVAMANARLVARTSVRQQVTNARLCDSVPILVQ
jgi:hypothetical protein